MPYMNIPTLWIFIFMSVPNGVPVVHMLWNLWDLKGAPQTKPPWSCCPPIFRSSSLFHFPHFHRLSHLKKHAETHKKTPLPSLLKRSLWFSKPRCSVKESYKITEPGAEAPTISSAFCPDKSPRNKWEPGKKPMAPFKGSAWRSEGRIGDLENTRRNYWDLV